MDLAPLSAASLRALSLRVCCHGGPRCVRELRLYLALSSVLHCLDVKATCCLHDPGSGSGVVICTLPLILPVGASASVGGSSLRPAAAGTSFPGGPR